MNKLNTKHIDKTFWTIFIILIALATLALTSALATTIYKHNGSFSPILTQLVWYGIGIGCAYAIQFCPSNYIRIVGYGVFAVSLVCLYLVLIPGNPFVIEENDAGRWIKFGPLPGFQPSEFAKLSLIIVVGDLLSRIKTEEDQRKYFLITLGLTLLTVLPIMISNLSTALLLFAVIFCLWIIACLPWKYWLTTALVGISVLVAGYFIVKYGFMQTERKLPKIAKRGVTWVNRVDGFIAEFNAPKENKFTLDDNLQRNTAKIAVARGSASPFGVLPGRSKERDYLPLAYADYIFAIIVEEWGFLGSGFLIFCYLAILFRACWTSSRYEDYAAIFMVMGLALMLTMQAAVSMLVAVGIGPVTGQPLPLFSRGGTSVIITSVYFGIMMAVSREQAARKAGETAIMEESMEELPEIEIDLDEIK